MTVQYSRLLVTKKYFGFLRLLFLWRGSVYKLIWKDMLMFLVLYYALLVLYKLILPDKSKRVFVEAVVYCNNFSNLLPLQFVVAFYVNRVFSRFGEQLNALPWPAKPAIYVSAYVRGHTDESRMMRRSIVRYLMLSFVMTLTSISPQAKKRFPTLTHVAEAGFLLPKEQQVIESMSYTGNKYLVPCVWAATVVAKARKDGKIKDDFSFQKLLSEICEWRGACGTLFAYDAVTIPLVYTQVLTVAVYTFVVACLVGRRETNDGFRGDFNFPFFTLINLTIYLGWTKIAQALINPFGDDDDDFELNGLIDRHLREAYLIVDTLYEILPEMIKDLYWNQTNFNMPYTVATQHTNKQIFQGSAVSMVIPEDKQQIVAHDSHMMRRRSTVVKMVDENVLSRRNSLLSPTMKQSDTSMSQSSFQTAASGSQQPTLDKVNPNLFLGSMGTPIDGMGLSSESQASVVVADASEKGGN